MTKKHNTWKLLAVLILVISLFASIYLQAWTLFRNDVVEVIFSDNGQRWGNWLRAEFCDPGDYVQSFALQVEQPRGDGDDTALNNIELRCADRFGRSGNIFYALGSPGWGTWGHPTSCGQGEHVVGFKLRVEPSQGGDGDDTAVNSMIVICSDRSILTPPNGGPWGRWGELQECPPESAVCGMSLKIEPSLGDGDDTAVNDVSFYCCEKR